MEPFSVGQLISGVVAVAGAITMFYQFYAGKPMGIISIIMFFAGVIGFILF